MPSDAQKAHHEASHAVLIIISGGSFGSISINSRAFRLPNGKLGIEWGYVDQIASVPADQCHVAALAGVVGALHLDVPWVSGTSVDSPEAERLAARVRSRLNETDCGSDHAWYVRATGVQEPTTAHIVQAAESVARYWQAISAVTQELLSVMPENVSHARAAELVARSDYH